MDYDDRITAETWDLAEEKWRALSLGAEIHTPAWDKKHPRLAKLAFRCSFCALFFWGGHCVGCPLKDVPEGEEPNCGGDLGGWCCAGLYVAYEDAARYKESPRKAAGAVLRFIRAQRAKWEQSLNTPSADCKPD